MSVLETVGSLVAVLIVVVIILVFWTILWKYFLSKLKFLREICKFWRNFSSNKEFLVGTDNGQSEPVKKQANQRPTEEEARRAREERIKLRRSRKAE